MTTIRRIYAYLLAFAGLAMFLVAAANLTQVLVDVLLQSPTATAERYVQNTVSLYGAAALVGLPVWLVHWLWIGRVARSDPHERSSVFRRLYLYVVLAGATAFLAESAFDILDAAFGALLGVPSSTPILDALARPLPFGLIAALAWFAHWRIAAADRAAVGESSGSATLRRWYMYGAAFVGLVMVLMGTQGVVETLWRLLTSPDALGVVRSLAAQAAGAIVGLVLWLAHWVVLPARLPTSARDDDGTSVLRSVYLFLALAVCVIGTLSGVSQLLYYGVGRVLGVARPGGVGGDLLQAAAGPVSTAIVFGAAWAYQREFVRRQTATFAETPRQAGIRRLYAYLVALVGLGVLATGVGGLLWALGDLIVRGMSDPDLVARYATLTVVGLPVWLLHWQASPADPVEVHSLSRRLYVYISLIVAMLTLIGSAAATLYRVFGLLLGSGATPAELQLDLAHNLAIAIAAALVAAYHWRVLRTDARRIVAEPVAPPEPTLARAVVEIQAPDEASLSRALSALRSTGVQVTVR